jgi:hypothetical protein
MQRPCSNKLSDKGTVRRPSSRADENKIDDEANEVLTYAPALETLHQRLEKKKRKKKATHVRSADASDPVISCAR